MAAKFDGSRFQTRQGRPQVQPDIEALAIRMAKENPAWGYDRIAGALHNLGHRISDQTVGNILQRVCQNPNEQWIKQVARNVTGWEGDLAGTQLLSAFLRGGVRQMPTSTLIRLHDLQSAPLGAHLCRVQNGAGVLFYRVRYELPRVDGRRQRRYIYLGTDPVVAEWAADILAEHQWRSEQHEAPAIDRDRIAQLKRLRRRVTGVARQIAKRAGYSFRGSRLMKNRYE